MRIQVNNRKLVEGFYRGVGLDDTAAALRGVDKLDKIGPDAGRASCCSPSAGRATPRPGAVPRAGRDLRRRRVLRRAVRALGVEHPLLDEGLDELVAVVEAAAEHAPGLVVADLRIARGLDYYTGTVYETQLRRATSTSARSARAAATTRWPATAAPTYPGVGISIGVTRLLVPLLGRGARSRRAARCPPCVLVAVVDEEARGAARRRRGRRCGRAASPPRSRRAAAKFGKQIRYADRRGIPFVWFPGADGGRPGQGHPLRRAGPRPTPRPGRRLGRPTLVAPA